MLPSREMERLADFRNVYAQVVVAVAGCGEDERLLRAFASVPRHLFLGPGPWGVAAGGKRTGSTDAALVYQNVGFGLAPGIPNGLPSLHAELLHAADLRAGERAMHVGAGAGYYTAILAELVGPSGRVIGFEIDDALASRAQKNLAGWPWAVVEPRSGLVVPEQPVDLIYVNAGVQQFPLVWLEALSPRGRIIFPLVPGDGTGAVFMVQRGVETAAHSVRFVSRAQFVPCIGTQDPEVAMRLSDVFRGDSCERVTSLHLAPEVADETAWFVGDGWWLSTASAWKAPQTAHDAAGLTAATPKLDASIC